MDIEQLLLYTLIAFAVFFIIRKILLIKSIKHYSPVDAFDKLRKGTGTLFLDVRTAAERKEHKINGSHHIPLPEINSRYNELLKFKGKEIICYCRSGNRSLSAAAKLKRQGFDVANLRGGISQWSSAGLR
ncbi:MAG: rhodanese-like domain-containing protein [Ignavibacteria bacterium]|nr:rhodanese-like domain-containing protein [Ignavibacteria bacterium]MBT8381461.1 rhodanese-like domain-containing protein [Ignavibacteria bacterium]MBT8391523.1 rhodanese-like domain-containing protein [Ignavibacteria bacterium]NNJ52215.1 rhodanese-like domain-containing protein [Ignavibacteriaceae bacterium]NNL22691.1 rhodanese-like domain-containing protein [Ignavibacteriaceae bacterium]